MLDRLKPRSILRAAKEDTMREAFQSIGALDAWLSNHPEYTVTDLWIDGLGTTWADLALIIPEDTNV